MTTGAQFLLNALTFSRASARTNSDTGAEIATGVAFTPTIEEIVPTRISTVAGSTGYVYIGRLSDGRYVFQSAANIYTSTDGEPPYTLLVSNAYVSRITPADTFLRYTSSEPADIYRRPAPYTVETKVHTLQRGYLTGAGISGTNTYAARVMGFDAHGSTIIVGEYSNTAGIKDSNDPPRYLHRSDDDGATWAVIDPAPTAGPGTHVHAIFYDDVTGNWYMSMGDTLTNPVTGVYKSVDDGLNWTHIAGPTVANEYDVGIQPVSAIRFGSYIVWGTDTVPSGVWLHDTDTDTFTRAPFDFIDSAASPVVTWTGVVYNLAVLGAFLLIIPSASIQEDYHKVFATADFAHFWQILDTDSGGEAWQLPIIREDQSFLLSLDKAVSVPYVKVDALTLITHAAIATDEAAETLTPSTTPMDGTFWTISAGEYIGETGPGGMRAYKLGDFRRDWNLTAIGENVPTEFNAWVRNPLSLPQTALAYFVIQAGNAANGLISTTQKGISAFYVPVGEWRRMTFRYTTPANTVKLGLRMLLIGATYNAATSYFEVAGLTVSRAYDADVETHDRAAESATVDEDVGAAWGVYDRVFPRWDTQIDMPTDKTLLTLTDVETSAYLSVIYNATSQAFEITDGTDTVNGPTVRCMGSATRAYGRVGAITRLYYGSRDFMAYGVRRTSSGVELVVWDKLSREITAVTAPGSFVPSNLRITFPASGVLHVPSFATGELTDAQTFSALQGIMPNADTPGDVSAIDTAPCVTLSEFVDGATVIDGAARVTLAEFADGVTTDEIAPWLALEEWPQ